MQPQRLLLRRTFGAAPPISKLPVVGAEQRLQGETLSAYVQRIDPSLKLISKDRYAELKAAAYVRGLANWTPQDLPTPNDQRSPGGRCFFGPLDGQEPPADVRRNFSSRFSIQVADELREQILRPVSMGSGAIFRDITTHTTIWHYIERIVGVGDMRYVTYAPEGTDNDELYRRVIRWMQRFSS